MSGICRWLIGIGVVAWALALVLFVVGTYGLFGQQRDPLSGVFLIPLGMPWVLWLDGFGETLRFWLGLAAPALNLALLAVICRMLRRNAG